MSEKRPDVIGSLPSTRPHRRSDKRATTVAGPPSTASGPAAKKPPANVRPRRSADARARRGDDAPAPSQAAGPSPAPERPNALETLIQATTELTEIGLRASARALRGAVSRLPRP